MVKTLSLKTKTFVFVPLHFVCSPSPLCPASSDSSYAMAMILLYFFKNQVSPEHSCASEANRKRIFSTSSYCKVKHFSEKPVKNFGLKLVGLKIAWLRLPDNDSKMQYKFLHQGMRIVTYGWYQINNRYY